MARKLRHAWTSVRVDARLAWRELLEIIDSRTVRLFQALMYCCWSMFGLYAVTFAEPVSIVDRAMGSFTYTIWVWVNIIGPLMVSVGCWLASGPGANGRASRRVTNGLIMQLGGDLAVMLMLAAMWASLLHSAWWGKGTHGAFTYVGLSICAAFLVIGDVRRLIVHSEWERR